MQVTEDSEESGVWVKPCYFDDEDMVMKLGEGIFYRDSYFSKNIVEEKVESVEVDVPIQRWTELDQY